MRRIDMLCSFKDQAPGNRAGGCLRIVNTPFIIVNEMKPPGKPLDTRHGHLGDAEAAGAAFESPIFAGKQRMLEYLGSHRDASASLRLAP